MFASLSAIALLALTAGAEPTPPKADEDAWPVAGGSDFKLTAELIARGTKDDKGVVHIGNNTLMNVRLKAEKECDVVIYWVDPKGHVVQLFPNRFDTSNRLKAGEERLLPPANKDYEFISIPTVGDGFDRLHVVATTGKLPAVPKGEYQGAYIAYKTDADRKALIRAVRGVIVREKPTTGVTADQQVAQAELKFRVKP